MPSDDLVTFADIHFGNLTEAEARFVQTNTPKEARAHFKRSFRDSDHYIVLVEDLSISSARELLAGLDEQRAALR